MVRPSSPVSRLWLPLVTGTGVICGLLLALHPTTAASPLAEQPTDVVVLWLTPPEAVSGSRLWPSLAEAHQAGWRARSAVVGERLTTLRDQGRIGAFGPLPSGVGFTVTAPAGLPPEVGRWREVDHVTSLGEATQEALDAWWQRGLDVANANIVRSGLLDTRQATTLTLNLGLHSRLVSGATLRPEPITLDLIRGSEVIASSTATPFPDGGGGYLYATTLNATYHLCGGSGGGYCYPAIEPDDVLLAVQAGKAVSLTVPFLTALADRDTATVYGQSAPSATLEIYLYRYDDPSVTYQRVVTASASGDYEVDFGSLTPVAPRDHGHVFYVDGAGNRAYARYNVPFLAVQIKDQYVDGTVAPCATVTATLCDYTGALRDLYHGSSTSDGTFQAYLSPAPQVGDTLVVTAAGQVVSMTVPPLIALPDPASDVIAGLTMPGSAVEVDLYRGPLQPGGSSCPPYGDPDHSLSVTATSTGTLAGAYAADFTVMTDVVAGDYGVVYATDPSGYEVYRCWAAPFLQLRVGDYQLTGQVNGSGPVTVAIRSSSGIHRDVRFVQAYNIGYFYDYGGSSELRLMAGDQVTVTAYDGQETGTTVPKLTANADTVNSIVTGQAPPDSLLRVNLSHTDSYPAGGGPPYPPDYGYTLWVTSTASGVYTADFSSLTTIKPRDSGTVFYVNPGGHEAYAEFRAPVAPAVRVQSGGNYVAGTLSIEQGEIVVTLRNASGRVKATATTWPYSLGSFDVYLYEDGQPAIIEAGDTVEVAAEDQSVTQRPRPTPYPRSTAGEAVANDILVIVTVPTLTAQCDRAADILSGQAPPNAPLKVTWDGGDAWDGESRTWIVTSTVAGSYSLDLSGQADLDRGDLTQVAWTDDNGNQVWVAYRTPGLDAALRSASVQVFGPAYRPLTLTLLGSSDTPIYTGTGIFDYSGEAWFFLYDQHSDAPLYLETGQTLVTSLAEEVMTVTLPHLTARVDSQANVVSGEAPPGARLMVSVDRYDYLWGYWPVTATITGTYRVDLGDSATDGHVVYLHPDGHRVTLEFYVPHIAVTLGRSYVHGVSPGPGVVTATLRDADGVLKGSGVDAYRGYSEWFSVYLTDAQQEPVMVSGGDVLIVEAGGSAMTMTVPTLTASFDRRTGILTGLAPARTWLQVGVGEGSRQVRANPDGTYAMDWSDLSPYPGTQGYVYITDNLGNEASLYFTVPYDVYLPMIVRDS
jgi:hypothetical protein